MCFEVQAQKPFFQYPPFLAPPSPATRVKAKTQKYFSKYLYLIFRKSQEVSNQYLYRFRSSIICKKSLGAKRPPPTKDRVKLLRRSFFLISLLLHWYLLASTSIYYILQCTNILSIFSIPLPLVRPKIWHFGMLEVRLNCSEGLFS